MAHIELMTDAQFEQYISQFGEDKRKRLIEERETLKEKEKERETEDEG